MVYKPKLDRQGFADRQTISQERNRPAIQYTKQDDVRELMRTPSGKNYSRMMDLQNEAIRRGGFDKGDPKVAELKDARRQYNRQDKRAIGDLMGYNPLDVQDIYRTNSGVLREYARPTYKDMYPISDFAHTVSESGGLTGALLSKAFGKSKKSGKNFFDDLRGMGRDIFGGIGIGGAVPRDEATEEILTNYADQTFGPINIHEDEPWPYEDTEVIEETTQDGNLISEDLWDSIRDFDPGTIGAGGKLHAGEDITVPPWLTDPSIPMPEELTEGEYLPGQYHDELIEEEVLAPVVPFDDSNREAGIMSQHGQGPKWGSTNRRYEADYRDYVEKLGDIPGGPMPYEEFVEAWEGMHALPRGLHFQEPRAGRR